MEAISGLSRRFWSDLLFENRAKLEDVRVLLADSLRRTLLSIHDLRDPRVPRGSHGWDPEAVPRDPRPIGFRGANWLHGTPKRFMNWGTN